LASSIDLNSSTCTARFIEARFRKKRNPKRAKLLSSFFKTGPGQYGEGDVFLGLSVPQIRAELRVFSKTSLTEIENLLHSPYHEVRLFALLLWVHQFTAKDAPSSVKRLIFRKYLQNIRFINNWDLVDLSAPHIVGGWLFGKNHECLYRMARSRHLWTRRVAVLATFYFIRQNEFVDTFKISKMLLDDEEDLMHKAVGWMLREVSKRDFAQAEAFIRQHGKRMPRTMLRYAIERFPEKLRKHYLMVTRSI